MLQAVKMGAKAKSRGQLSALLSDAVANREELKERIAQGRAARKSAGNKYGELVRKARGRREYRLMQLVRRFLSGLARILCVNTVCVALIAKLRKLGTLDHSLLFFKLSLSLPEFNSTMATAVCIPKPLRPQEAVDSPPRSSHPPPSSTSSPPPSSSSPRSSSRRSSSRPSAPSAPAAPPPPSSSSPPI